MGNFCSPFVQFKTTGYKTCSVNVSSVALIVSDGPNKCTLYVKGDPIGANLTISEEAALEVINNKLRDLHYE